ncbi:MAG: phosphotransferase [Deltaproteobacteria bacterium]|jgi:phosphate uptake regulator|nr:phosphotransferase [Deltaproteobacteria bacterium]
MRDAFSSDFRLLTTEVLHAAYEAKDLLTKRDPAKSRALYYRVSYITTQVASLQKASMDLALQKPAGQRESLYLQGLSSVASRLERISDLMLNLDRQAGYLNDLNFLESYNLAEFFQHIFQGLEKIHPALVNRDVNLAVRLGQVEEKLDALYAARFSRLIKEFGPEVSAGDLVTVLMIVHYLERIGDMLLEIGEKIIYIIMGEKIKLEQYKALGEGLKAAGAASMEPASLDFHSIWGGRSGCRIGVVGKPDVNGLSQVGQTVVFKHGPASKLTRERENLELWDEIRPGLTPKVKAFIPAQAGTEAALMLEFIPSRNLQAIFMEKASDSAFGGLRQAFQTMIDLWVESRRDITAKSDFCLQAQERLPEARTVYPKLIDHYGSVGQWPLRSVPGLLEEAKKLEATLAAPFKVRIHGDFNLSNLLYDPEAKKLNFVDLYRSREADYIQDVSVMLLSIIRLPVVSYEARKKLCQAALVGEGIARRFASSVGDETFEARLAFGLARSFITSVRFVLEEKLAALFVARARYLWERLLDHGRRGGQWADFHYSLDIFDINLD